MHRLSRALSAGALALATALPAAAEDIDPAILAASCAICHGPGGHSPGAIPPLAGLDAQAMTDKLLAFRSGAAEATVMNRIAKGYTEAEIAALSAWLAEGGR
jgi:cytochrome c553